MVFTGERPFSTATRLHLERSAKCGQASLHFLIRPPGPQLPQLRHLGLLYLFADVEDLRRLLIDHMRIHADNDLLLRLHRALVRVTRSSDLLLRESRFDRSHHSAHRIQFVEVRECALLHIERQLFDEVAAAQRIGDVGHPGFMRENLLRPQRDAGRIFGRQRQRLIKRIGVQRLRSAQHRRHRLQRHPDDVVLRLLRGQRNARRLGVKPHPRGSRVRRAEPLRHQPVPDFSSRAVLRDLFKKVVVRIEKEAQPGSEIVDRAGLAGAPTPHTRRRHRA